MEWQFYRQDPTDPVLNPIAGEFFSSEAVGDAADALVREAIQNSLDARTRGADNVTSPARVRIFLSGDDGALSSAEIATWFGGIWPHVAASNNGLADPPSAEDRCPFLVVEDFGTCGLDGDPEAYCPDPGNPNNFLNFFRAFGHSDKGTHAKGSWGVGKTVFPRSSRISSFFGLTVRANDDRGMLLGRSVLKYHRVADQPFKSDGYFGERRNDGFVLPCEDPAALRRFREAFNIERASEPGLSIVVPWYTTTGDGCITKDDVVRAVISGFFYPMLAGDLEVHVVTPNDSQKLAATTLGEVLKGRTEKWAAVLLPIIELAQWWRENKGSVAATLVAPPPSSAQKWTPETITPETTKTLIPLALEHKRFAVRVPMSVRPRGAEPVSTHFDVICETTPDDSMNPVFIRDGLIISDVRPARATRGVRSIVVVEDDALASFLRDAETPAHTEWTPSTANFKTKYVYGPSAIDYVRAAVPELFAAIRRSDTAPDLDITLDAFFLETAGGGQGNSLREKKKLPDRKKQLPRFAISKVDGGFTLKRPPPPKEPRPAFEKFAIRIQAAYDVRSGSALRSYSPFDFDVAKAPVKIEQSGMRIISAVGKCIVAVVEDPEFRINVTGFDSNRDLFVDARVIKGEDDDDSED